MDDDHLAEIRSTRIGFIFQSYNLLSALSVVENIQVPLYYSRRVNAETRNRCVKLAEMVGLRDRLNHRPTQLSGGQQQRVAIARSLVNDPQFILADEPTGNLDTATSNEILDLLERLNREGRTIIMVTHEPEVAARTKRSIHLRDGQIVSDERN
jgi:putative ABC transport system ATP-binding protein